jgi:hypothetical protein
VMFHMHPLNHKVNTPIERVTRDGFLLVGGEERDTCDELGGVSGLDQTSLINIFLQCYSVATYRHLASIPIFCSPTDQAPT